jgi:tRNA threonylcarbamoyladenosine biosynthesis protein TsaE
MADEETVVLRLPEVNDTEQLGRMIASAVASRMILALTGPLGAGKTTLVKSLAAALGVREHVTSPTFTMLNEYDSGRLPLYHTDLYRLSEEGEELLGLLLTEFDELLANDCVLVIEWADLMNLNQAGSRYFSQLDYLVVRLDYESGNSLYVEEVKPSKESSENCPSFYIEAGRIAELKAHGPVSGEQLNSLKSRCSEYMNNL